MKSTTDKIIFFTRLGLVGLTIYFTSHILIGFSKVIVILCDLLQSETFSQESAILYSCISIYVISQIVTLILKVITWIDKTLFKEKGKLTKE